MGRNLTDAKRKRESRSSFNLKKHIRTDDAALKTMSSEESAVWAMRRYKGCEQAAVSNERKEAPIYQRQGRKALVPHTYIARAQTRR
jgi:hypothetical protein